jgi:UDP-glucose 4-epimerase
MREEERSVPYRNKRVLVTGGLGFIGSNLALRLASLGAQVTVVDSCVEGCGANAANLEGDGGRIAVVKCPISDEETLRERLASTDIVFNLAGEISHIHSMLSPDRDLKLNCLEQLQFVQACRLYAPGVRVVYAGTRQVYGRPRYLPVDERHPVQAVDFNGIHKHAAEHYHILHTDLGALDAIVLRLTNIYGPRQALNLPCQGFLGGFMRRSLCGAALEVFGAGDQLRDPLYVDDAVEAFLRAGLAVNPASRIYNVGGPAPLSLREIAECVAEAGGQGSVVSSRPFPAHLRGIDIGSYWTDSSRIRLELGWTPEVRFADGVRRTMAYYAGRLPSYLDPVTPRPVCSLPLHLLAATDHATVKA